MTHDTTADSLFGILDELTELISAARAMPMSASVLVNRAEVLDLLGSAREALPGQLARADKLLADADAVLAQAEAEAERKLSNDSIVAEARARAEKLARDADEYCEQTLADLEIDLGRITSQVTAGRARLAERISQEGLT